MLALGPQRLTSGAGGVARLPLQSRIAFMGDSITNFVTINSYVEWTKLLLGGRYYAGEFSNQGISSQTTTQMLARLSTFTALNAKVAVVLGGTNDLGLNQTPAATIQSNLRAMYDGMIAAGSKVVAMTIMPRNGSSVLPAPQEIDRLAVNAWIKTQTDITVVDLEAYNPTTQSTDGLHPGANGALFIANLLTPVLAAKISSSSIILPASDPSNLVINPTLSGSVAITQGVIASNYTLTVPAAATTCVATAKSTLADGNPAQLFTLSGIPATNSLVTFESDAFTINGLSGDLFEAWCSYEMVGLCGLLAHRLVLGSGNVANAFSDATAGTIVTAAGAITKSGVMRARPITLGGTTATTTFKFSFFLYNNAGDIGSNLAGTMKIGNIFVRKVPAGL